MSEAQQPPRDRVTKAIKDAMTPDVEAGRVMKVLFLDDQGEPVGEYHSTQLPEDPFKNLQGIMDPPFQMEQLVYLAETHPVHSAALEQKVADIMGKGWEWETPDSEEGDQANEAERDVLSEWFESLAPSDESMKEIVQAAWDDYETVGWGTIEVARDPSGIAKRIYHVPAHTVRAHKDGVRLVQIRNNKKVWFRRWGIPVESGEQEIQVDAKTGSKTTVRDPANDLFVIRKITRRSTWYGIPGYISAVGWITLSLAARDDNLLYFANRREPRWAIILSNLQDDPNVAEDLRRAIAVDLQQPHRTILIPIAGEGKVEFQKLSENAKDGSFDKLSERADKAIMVAHRIPAERLANSQIGPLGGNSTLAASRIYKEGVVKPGQEILQTRLNKFIDVEYNKAQGGTAKDDSKAPVWQLVMDDLDVQSDQEDLDLVVERFTKDLITLREARKELKLGPLMVLSDPHDPESEEIESPYNEMLYSELPGVAKGGGGGGGGSLMDQNQQEPALTPEDLALARDESFLVMQEDVRTLVRASADFQERLEEIASRVEAER